MSRTQLQADKIIDLLQRQNAQHQRYAEQQQKDNEAFQEKMFGKTCGRCNGSGKEMVIEFNTCTYCSGLGTRSYSQGSICLNCAGKKKKCICDKLVFDYSLLIEATANFTKQVVLVDPKFVMDGKHGFFASKYFDPSEMSMTTSLLGCST